LIFLSRAFLFNQHFKYNKTMTNIKTILDEIAAEPGSNAKMEILAKHKDNDLLKMVMYMAKSPRLKYYIKQIPSYVKDTFELNMPLPQALDTMMEVLPTRKATGGAASAILQALLQSVTVDDAYIIERIIDKDLKIGMGTSNINKVFKDLIEKTPYMGAKSFSEKLAKEIFNPKTKGAQKESKMAYSQIKMDGRYCNAIIEDGEAYLESRSGETTLLTNSRLMSELSQFGDCVLNGELTIPGFDRNTANGIVNSVIGITTKLRDGENPQDEKDHLFERYNQTYEQLLNKIVYTVWDRIELDDYEDKKSDVPYNDRLGRLMTELVANQDNDMQCIELIEMKLVTTYAQAMEHFVEALNRGLEGTILKSLDGAWKDGKPNWQIKMKLEIDIDMKIIGFNYGTIGTKNEKLISSLTVESADGKVVTKPTGISEADMKKITANQESLMGRIIEMKCCGLSHDRDGNYSTLHPVFKSIRDDKDEADSFEAIQEIENMAKSLPQV
jgi:DNA ligase-1